MSNTTNMKNWAAQERLRMVERTVWWRGWIKRKDLVEVFGISAAQASSDLQKYQEINPGALIYQMSRKRYEGAEGMQCVLHEPRLEEGLAGFLGGGVSVSLYSQSGSESEEGGGRGSSSRFQVANLGLPLRRAKPDTERFSVLAVAGGMKFRVQYFSVSSGRASWRWLAPHAFAHDGYRWHLRAWCYEREGYRDFVLGRFKNVEWPVVHEDTLPADEKWETVEVLRLRPNSALSEESRRGIEMDYGIRKNGVLKISVRAAMKHYLLGHLRIEGEGVELPNHFELSD